MNSDFFFTNFAVCFNLLQENFCSRIKIDKKNVNVIVYFLSKKANLSLFGKMKLSFKKKKIRFRNSELDV